MTDRLEFKILGSDRKYTLEEILTMIKENPDYLFIAYQIGPNKGGFDAHHKTCLGQMSAETIEQKFG